MPKAMAIKPIILSDLDGISFKVRAQSFAFTGKAKYGIPSIIRSTPNKESRNVIC